MVGKVVLDGDGDDRCALRRVARSQDGQARRRLQRLTAHPVGCARLRERHAPLVGEAGCDCRFSGLWGGAYPTPVLHVLRPAEVPVFRRQQEEARHRRRKARAAAAPERREPAPAAGDRFERAFGKLSNLYRQRESVDRGLARAEAELDALFDEAATDRVRLPTGTLVRRQGERPRFVVEP